MVEDKKNSSSTELHNMKWKGKIGENEIDNKVFGKSPEKFSTPMLFINGNCLFAVRKYKLASVYAAVFISTHTSFLS